MTLRAGTDATLGGIAATQAGNLVVNANRNLTATADGRLQAAGALDLQAGAALRAQRITFCERSCDIHFTSQVRTQGELKMKLGVTLTRAVKPGRGAASVPIFLRSLISILTLRLLINCRLKNAVPPVW